MSVNFIARFDGDLAPVEEENRVHREIVRELVASLDRTEKSRLDHAIRAAIVSAEATAIVLASAGERLGNLVSIRPAREEGMAVVTLCNLSEPPQTLSLDMMMQILPITRAEAVVARMLLEGQSVDAIAASRAVSRETVRAQVKSLLGKLGLPNQKRLIMLLSRIALALPVKPGSFARPCLQVD